MNGSPPSSSDEADFTTGEVSNPPKQVEAKVFEYNGKKEVEETKIECLISVNQTEKDLTTIENGKKVTQLTLFPYFK